MEVWECIESLPSERRTVTLCSFLPVADPPQPILGWRRPVYGQHDAVARLRLAVSRCHAPFLLFVSADCRLRDPLMMDVALGHLAQGAVVVGGLLAQGDVVSAAGYAFGTRGPYPRFGGWSVQNERVQRPAGLQAVPLPFLGTRRNAWMALDGLRPHFQDRPYADADYCIRAARLGLGIPLYEPAIVVDCPPLPATDPRAVELLMASAQPAYDEWQTL